MVEYRTLNLGSLGSNPFAAISKLRHFRSIHSVPIHSTEYPATKLESVFLQNIGQQMFSLVQHLFFKNVRSDLKSSIKHE